ncbi:MAG: TCR/Tet family MFS transporter [Chloroflexi bacterium]|nr:TCR/Tet family MFS transporter [Chloroflexota bacterium]
MDKRLYNVGLIVLVDMLGFALIIPLLAFFADSFGASAFQTGLLVASYAAMQMISAPILGRISDRFGRRPVFLISIFGTIVGFLILGFAQSLWMLFLSRILSGLTAGNISVAQAYIADITDEKNRARGMGLFGAAFGVGFILGPAMGSILSQFGFDVPSFVAAGLAFINFLAVFYWLPESLTEERRAELQSQEKKDISFKALLAALRRPLVGPLLWIRFGFSIAFNSFQTVFPLYVLYKFELGAQEAGYILTYIGVVLVIMQGGAIGPLSERFKESNLLVTFLAFSLVGMIGWAAAPSIIWLLVALLPMSVGAGSFNALINSAISKAVGPEEIGGMLGFGAGMESSTRVVMPAVASYLLGAYGPEMPGIMGSIVLVVVVVYAYRQLLPKSKMVSV